MGTDEAKIAAKFDEARARLDARQREVERRLAAREAKRQRPPLSLDAIVDAALAIVDAEGTDAVSMRRVAAAFNTGPASLYAYVRDKDELLQLVLDRISAEMEIPQSGDWQQMVRGWAWNARTVFQRHQDAARLSFGWIPRSERMYDGAERLLGAMTAAGVPDQVAAWALDIMSLYIAADAFEGWLYTQRFDDGSGRPTEEVGAEYFTGLMEDAVTALPAARYPNLARLAGAMVSGGSDERFDFGVNMLIAGFAAQIPAS